MKKKRKIESTTGSATPATGRKRQDVSDKKREDKFFDRHVVKCTIGPFSKFKVVTDELISCVHWMSRIMVHTSHVVTLMIVERQGSLPIRVDKDTGETTPEASSSSRSVSMSERVSVTGRAGVPYCNRSGRSPLSIGLQTASHVLGIATISRILGRICSRGCAGFG